MPSKNKQYNLVQSDDLDTRIPLMPEDAFQHGIPFNCKFIGSMDIPRPTSRVEIVAAMRRVRVEFKSKGVKKKKVTVTVSVDGIKTTLRKKNRKRKKRNNANAYADVDGGNNMVILSHPVYRIFYVSHDSQDVKIFSYIARETSSNVFHCCVFKAANKNQAMRIVRTVGQAFEVCHKLVGHAGEEDESEDVHESETNISSQLDSSKEGSSSQKPTQEQLIQEPVPANAGSSTSLLADNKPASTSSNTSTPPVILSSSLTPLNHEEPSSVKGNNKPKNLDLNRRDANIVQASSNDLMNLTTPSSSAVPTPTQAQSFFKENTTNKGPKDKENLAQVHEAQLLKEQLDQQTQNTRAALAQIQLLRDQLAAESAARIEAQARTHQLLIHNKELLDHLQTLVRHIQELEAVTGGNKDRLSSNNSIAAATATGVTLPQLTPRSKIERWFSFVVPPTNADEEDNAEDDVYSGEFENLDKAVRNLRLSRRTLLSNKESGFVSETNELTDAKQIQQGSSAKAPRQSRRTPKKNKSNAHHNNHNHLHHHRHNANGSHRLSSTSSWLRRVLRLKRSGYTRNKQKNENHMDYFNNDTHSSSSLRKRSLSRGNSVKSRVSSL